LKEQEESVTFANAQYSEHIDPSLFLLQAELKPGYSLDAVETALTEEVERLGNEPLAEAELAKAKRQTEAQFVLGNEEVLNQAILLGEYETIAFRESVPEDARGYRYLDAYLDRVRSVTTADIQRVVKTYLHRDNRTVGRLVNEMETAEVAA
jgi:zinc protease